MGIPATLSIYVPDDSAQLSNELRADLRAALLASYVGPREGFPLDDDGRAYAEAVRALYHEHPGLEDVVTFGGTLVFREYTRYGNHTFRREVPSGIDFDQHNDAEGDVNAEFETRRGGRYSTWSSNTEEDVLVPACEVLRVLEKCKEGEETRLRVLLKELCEVPEPSYSVGDRRYEEDWE